MSGNDEKERKLSEYAALLTRAESLAHLGVWRWDASTGEVTWSPELYRIFGEDPDSHAPSFESYLSKIHPEDQQRVSAAVLETLEWGGGFQHDERIYRPDGSLRHLRSAGMVFPGSKGDAPSMIGTCFDITELHEAMEGTRRTAERLEIALAAAEMGLWEWIPATGAVTWSGEVEKIFGLAPGTFSGTYEAYLDLIHPDDKPALMDAIQGAIEGAPDYTVRHRIRWADGSLHWLEGHGRVFRDAAGRPERMAGSVRDITESVKAQQALLQTQKLESLGLLAGGIAHDFNNLLTALLGNLELVRMRLDKKPESAVAHLHNAEAIALRAAELVREMLAYSGRGAFVTRTVSLSDAVEEITHLLSVSISKKVSIAFELAKGLPPIQADPAQLHQVVMNLVTNASDAIGDRDGRIVVRTGLCELDAGAIHEDFTGQSLHPGRFLMLEVEDTGGGMSPDVMARIFDPFFTTKASGHGLGLSALVGILRSHHGGYRIRSEVGHGTRFTILWPSSAEKAETPSGEARALGTLPKGRILLVDDEVETLEASTAMLSAMGLRVVAAKDGREALDLLCKGPLPDLMILDLAMPRMDGRETLREIRDAGWAFPVLLSSGLGEQEAAEGVENLRPAGFLAKPYLYEDLLQAVRRALRKQNP